MPNVDPTLLQDPARLNALRALCLLDAPVSPALERLTRLASRILNAPVALVSLVDENRQFFASQTGLSEPTASQRQTPLSHSFCQHVVANDEMLIVEDAHAHPLVYDNQAIIDLNIIAYAGIPLKLNDQVLGSFCVIDHEARHWTDEEIATLQDLAASVMTELDLHAQLIERQKTERALRDSQQSMQIYIDHLSMVRRIDAELSETLNLEHVLLVAMDAAIRMSTADHGFIALLENDELRIVQCIGRYYRGVPLPREGVIDQVLTSGSPVLIEDRSAQGDQRVGLPDTVGQMVFPLMYREHIIGVLNLESKFGGRFKIETLEYLNLITPRITAAIDNARLYALSRAQLDELSRVHQRVSELEQIKTDIIRIAVHDLRGSLTGVLGLSELMLEEGERFAASDRDLLASIHDAGKRMQRIIMDILSLERAEAMQQNSAQEPVDLRALVAHVYQELYGHAEAKLHLYDLNVPDLPVYVQGDRAHLEQAVSNLVTNAIKYTPEGGTVLLRLEQENGRVVFEVEDTGCGIPEEQQVRLFQPFFRARTKETLSIEGTGLGLHLVKNIIERHQGKMRMHSVYGAGSTFGFEMRSLN